MARNNIRNDKNALSEPKKIPFLVNFGVKCGVFAMAMVNVKAVEVWGFGAGPLGDVGVWGLQIKGSHLIKPGGIKKCHSEPQKIPFLVNFGVKCGVSAMAMVNIEVVEVWGFGAGPLGDVGVTMDLWHQITSEMIKMPFLSPKRSHFWSILG